MNDTLKDNLSTINDGVPFMEKIMFVPVLDFTILVAIIALVAFGVGWGCNQLRKPPPQKRG